MTTYAKRKRDRSADDFYRTPAWCVRALLDRVDLSRYRAIFDPCAGDGAILAVLREVLRDREVHGVEIDPQRAEAADALCADWFGLEGVGVLVDPCAAIVMNPPFSRALEFVADCTSRFRFVAALLRLNFLASQQRREFVSARPPTAIYVLSKRPSFTADGQTDASDYAWFVWDRSPDASRLTTRIEVV